MSNNINNDVPFFDVWRPMAEFPNNFVNICYICVRSIQKFKSIAPLHLFLTVHCTSYFHPHPSHETTVYLTSHSNCVVSLQLQTMNAWNGDGPCPTTQINTTQYNQQHLLQRQTTKQLPVQAKEQAAKWTYIDKNKNIQCCEEQQLIGWIQKGFFSACQLKKKS